VRVVKGEGSDGGITMGAIRGMRVMSGNGIMSGNSSNRLRRMRIGAIGLRITTRRLFSSACRHR
jgi:hypothetical protein